MKKFLLSLMALFMGVTTATFAGQYDFGEWNGSNKTLLLKPDTAMTFSYTAVEDGILYIYTDNQGSEDNVPLHLEGGKYVDGAIAAEDSLQGVEAYENGLGFYGWIKVEKDDKIRFTISTPEKAEGKSTRFTLKKLFFGKNVGGDSWENAIALSDQTVDIPIYKNEGAEVIDTLDLSYATYCKFTAPSDGIATILTSENVVYCIEKEHLGNPEHGFTSVVQDAETDDHEFVVSEGVEYIVVVPNIRPSSMTFKMTGKKVGQSPRFPKTISEFPTTVDLIAGDNYYAFSRELTDSTSMLVVDVAAGWNDSIIYMENHLERSTELAADMVTGSATTFVKNVDPRFLSGSSVIVNFKLSSADRFDAAAELSIRKATEGESFEQAISFVDDKVVFGAPGEYWCVYTSDMDGEYSFTATGGTIKHVNFVAGVEQKVADNLYRLRKGQTIYVCVVTTRGNARLSISGKKIIPGDYRDAAVPFNLGETVTFESRGKDFFYSFKAAENGLAYIQSVGYSVHFYEENSEGGQLNPIVTTDASDDTAVKYSYELAVDAGKTYIMEVGTANGTKGEQITVTTRFEVPVFGDVCATAIEIKNLNDTIKIGYAFDKITWFKITAEKTGYMHMFAKLGQAGNMSTQVGDCDSKSVNADSDGSKNNSYMGGYEATKVYVNEGETVYISVKTGRSNDEKQFGKNFYLVVAEPRAGENEQVAIEAEPYTEYTIMSGDNAYHQWYTFTLPAGKNATISILCSGKNYNGLTFYKEDMSTMLSSYKGDFVQTTVTDGTTTVGKTYEFAATDADRTFYIYTPIITGDLPVIWKIEGEGLDTDIAVEEVADETPVIYDLMGRRVENPSKGIYIINGVKRVIK